MHLLTLLSTALLTSSAASQAIGVNQVMPASNLWLLAKPNAASAAGKYGQGVYSCTERDFRGSCGWNNVVGANDWTGDGLTGRCFQFSLPVASIGPDPGVYCAAFTSQNDCGYYSGQITTPVPSGQAQTIALVYPGRTDLPLAQLNLQWAYCFRPDARNNPHKAIWGAA